MWEKYKTPFVTYVEEDLGIRIEKTEEAWLISRNNDEYKFAKDLDEAKSLLFEYYKCHKWTLIEFESLRYRMS